MPSAIRVVDRIQDMADYGSALTWAGLHTFNAGAAISVPTASARGLLIQSTDDDTTNPVIELRNSNDDIVLSYKPAMTPAADDWGSVPFELRSMYTGSNNANHWILGVFEGTSRLFGVSTLGATVSGTLQINPGRANIYYNNVNYGLSVDSQGICAVFLQGSVGVGEESPGAQHHVKSSGATVIGQIIEAAASQTANLFEINASGGSGGDLFKINASGGVFLPAIKSGATQVAAGAAANEVWKTSGHASLPDNVLMIGV